VRRLAAAIGALIAALLAPSAAAPAGTLERVDCRQKRVTILFWPQGHPAIESVNFPEFLLPHLEVYKPGAGYPDSNFRAFVGSGAGQWARSCREVNGKKVPSGIESKRSLSEASALQCSFPRKSFLDRVDMIDRSVLRVFTETELYARVVITALGGLATYNSSACVAEPPPSQRRPLDR
jgi:hypothetical protein